jgi:hypothetical protein
MNWTKTVGFNYININILKMQIVRMLQAVVIMLIVAIAASCTASKQYTSKLFAPRNPIEKDSQSVAIKFLELESLERDSMGYVSTNVFAGKDSDSSSSAFDKSEKLLVLQTDSIQKIKDEKNIILQTEPIAKTTIPGEIRKKRARD